MPDKLTQSNATVCGNSRALKRILKICPPGLSCPLIEILDGITTVAFRVAIFFNEQQSFAALIFYWERYYVVDKHMHTPLQDELLHYSA